MLQCLANFTGAKVKESYSDYVTQLNEAPPESNKTGDELLAEALNVLGLEVIPDESNGFDSND